ncbi:uncharacterized protein YcfL [Spirosoma lacussanchae]|uniref:hypothetical protein n=1 Tax=Spirosoma lacussanchae TaxID=1884249 RepID=UPI0011095A28|nr:hypothetical protein [Spirosoma lacussanchae]
MRVPVALCTLLLLVACKSNESESTLPIANVAMDTVFYVKRTVGNRAPRISLCAVGYLDDSASIILKNPRQPQKIYWQFFKLPKGKIDSLKCSLDCYDSDVNIQYQHQNTRQGNLKLIVNY